MTNQTKKLYRSRTDKIIGGVCGGLGQYLQLDPVLIRIVFVVLAFFHGLGIILYLILLIIIPEQSGEEVKINREEKAKEFLQEL